MNARVRIGAGIDPENVADGVVLNPFVGDIDEIIIWDHTRTPSEVTSAFNRTRSQVLGLEEYEPGLVPAEGVFDFGLDTGFVVVEEEVVVDDGDAAEDGTITTETEIVRVLGTFKPTLPGESSAVPILTGTDCGFDCWRAWPFHSSPDLCSLGC